MGVPPQVRPRDASDEPSNLSSLLRRFFPFYCILTALVTYGYALYDAYQIDGDALGYMDISDYIRAHQWSAIVNGYWHPMYPAFLALGHTLFHSTLANELRAYYFINFVIFLMEMAAMIAFTDSIAVLRENLQTAATRTSSLLDRYAMRYLGLALLVIASQRELSLGKVRPDALLQAFLLFAIAALLRYLASARIQYAALMGLALGCAYLTKSFAFVFALLCMLVLAAFAWLWMKRPLSRVIPAGLVALVCFGVIAGPYVAALSRSHGRLDFGDSGSLNLAWYVGGTEKMHLQPYMTSEFGSAEVHLKHPEKELLRSPQVLSYAEHPYGTNPDWFDPTFWNDQIKPHLNLKGELSRGSRNSVLVLRYLFNHPEALILLALFFALGARLNLPWKPGSAAFWIPSFALGALAWAIYAIVNTEERYVTFAYLCIILSLFATLRVRSTDSQTDSHPNRAESRKTLAAVLILLMAVLVTGESLRTVLEDRRQLSLRGLPGGWYDANQQNAAEALKSMGLQPGDSVACVGHVACLADFSWARLAGVRILTEVYAPNGTPAYEFLNELPNRDQVIDIVRAQGAKVLIADFANQPVAGTTAAAPGWQQGWQQLGDSTLYELPLNVPPGTVPKRPPPPVRTKPSI